MTITFVAQIKHPLDGQKFTTHHAIHSTIAKDLVQKTSDLMENGALQNELPDWVENNSNTCLVRKITPSAIKKLIDINPDINSKIKQILNFAVKNNVPVSIDSYLYITGMGCITLHNEHVGYNELTVCSSNLKKILTALKLHEYPHNGDGYIFMQLLLEDAVELYFEDENRDRDLDDYIEALRNQLNWLREKGYKRTEIYVPLG